MPLRAASAPTDGDEEQADAAAKEGLCPARMRREKRNRRVCVLLIVRITARVGRALQRLRGRVRRVGDGEEFAAE